MVGLPYGDCSGFLWTLSQDIERDQMCDLYNVSAKEADGSAKCDPEDDPIQEECVWWVPIWDRDVEYVGSETYIEPGDGYLKPETWMGYSVPIGPDFNNNHYTSNEYVNAYGDLTYSSGRIAHYYYEESPGELGYCWAKDLQILEEDMTPAPLEEVQYGYQACIMNLADVWRYYGGEVKMNTVPAFGSGVGIDIEFIEPPEIPPEFYADTDAAAEKMDQFIEIRKGPDICKLDNCIRFSKKVPGSNLSDNVDILSREILDKDDYNNSSYFGDICPIDPGYESFGCWTENYTGFDTELSSTLIDCCEWDDSINKWVTTDDPMNAPGFVDMYINSGMPMSHLFPDEYYAASGQYDSNHDGIGDQCSAWVEIENLEQSHHVLEDVYGTWVNSDAWVDYLTCGGGLPCDAPIQKVNEVWTDMSTGLPIKTTTDLPNPTPLGEAPQEFDELVNICDSCVFGSECGVQKYIVRGAQKMEFDVVGFAIDPQGIDATTGACACEEWDDDVCYDQYQKCWHPEDDGWKTDPAGYKTEVDLSEFIGGTSARPRFAGYRRMGNRPADSDPGSPNWSTRQITPACSPSSLFSLPLYYGDYIDDTTEIIYRRGWDENPVPEADGCQEIKMRFENEMHRQLTWEYMGQVEPNPGEPGFDWTAHPKGDMLWMDGNTTRMRVAIEKEGVPGFGDRYYWNRQWHSVPDDDSDGEDHDRPFSEDELGGTEGAVVFVPICPSGFFDPGIATVPVTPWEEVLWQVDPPSSWRPSTGRSFITNVFSSSGEVALQRDTVIGGSGEVSRRTESYTVVGADFPSSRFGLESITLTAAEAAELGYQRVDSLVVMDIVVGGADTDGAFVPTVYTHSETDGRSAFHEVGSAPFAVADPSLFFDRSSLTIYLIGGETPSGPLDRVWALDLRTFAWTDSLEGSPNGLQIPDGIGDAKVAVDTAGEKAYLVRAGQSPVVTYRFSVAEGAPKFDQLPVADTLPGARNGAAVAYDRRLSSIYFYGGYHSRLQKYYGDLWRQDVRTGKWTLVDDSDEGRAYSQMVVDKTGEIFLLGGVNEAGGISSSSAVAYDPMGTGERRWRSTGSGSSRGLTVGGAPFTAKFNEADSVVYDLSADPGEEMSAGVQVLLKSDSEALELLAFSETGFVRNSSPDPVGLSSFNLHAGEQWKLIVRARPGMEDIAAGASYTLSAKAAAAGDLLGQLSHPT